MGVRWTLSFCPGTSCKSVCQGAVDHTPQEDRLAGSGCVEAPGLGTKIQTPPCHLTLARAAGQRLRVPWAGRAPCRSEQSQSHRAAGVWAQLQ